MKTSRFRVDRPVMALVDSAGGYDDALLQAYGTARDFQRRRNIGRAILVSTIVGGCGWFFKLYLSLDGLAAFFIAALCSTLYMVFAYTLESFFSGEVDPFAPLWRRVIALLMRAVLAAAIALFAAIPWVVYALKDPIALELAHIATDEQQSLRGKVDATFGTAALAAKHATLKQEASAADDNLRVLPDLIIDQLQIASSCESQLTALVDGNRRKAAVWTARLPALAEIEASPSTTAAQLASATKERGRIRAAVSRLLEEVDVKRTECGRLRAQADEAKSRYVSDATTKKEKADKALASHQDTMTQVDSRVKSEYARVDAVASATVRINSGMEFAALLKVITRDAYALFLTLSIYGGLFLIDALPLALRLFARPGIYDAERRTDEAIRLMAAETRLMEAKVIHDVRRDELQGEDLRDAARAASRRRIPDAIDLAFGRGPMTPKPAT